MVQSARRTVVVGEVESLGSESARAHSLLQKWVRSTCWVLHRPWLIVGIPVGFVF